MNFKEWLNEADIPMKDKNGKWYDAETGIYFSETVAAIKSKEKSQLSKKANDALQIAKSFGGIALSGSLKQKEWAEVIRAEKIQKMIRDDAELVCEPTNLLRHSKFWIENRHRTEDEIVGFVKQYKALLAQFDKFEKGSESARKIAAEYNMLTKQWGFNK